MSPFLGTRGAGSSKAFDPGAGRPNQVTGLTATDFGTSRAYNDGRIDLSWTAPANNGAPITGYKIERSTDGSTYSTLVANTGSSATTYSNTGLNSAQIYYYRVAAINAVGTGTNSSAANATSTTIPQAPTIGTPTCATGQAYTGSANISVPFTANATGGKSITSYTITPSAGGGTGTGASSPITISRTVGTSYTFTVTATNANGTSSASTASASVLSASVPQAPTIGTATAGTESASVTFTGNATGGSAITTYTMTSSPGSVTGTGGSSPITVSNLTAGTAYTFTVTATNAYGTSTASAASNSVTPIAPYFVGFAEQASAPSLNGNILSATALDSSGNFIIAGNGKSSDNSKTYCYMGKMNSSGILQWQRNFQLINDGNNTNGIKRIKAATSGNIYAIGVLVGSPSDMIFLAKYDSSGNFQWAKDLRCATSTTIYQAYQFLNTVSLALDSSENVYATVQGSQNSLSTTTLFKFNSSGTLQWQKGIQNSTTDRALWTGALTVDSSGNVFVGGSTTNGNSNVDFYIAKLNSSGTSQWVRKIIPGTSDIYQYSTSFWDAAVDSVGNVYFVGATKNSSGGYPGYIVKYDTNGNIQWQKTLTNTTVSAATVSNTIQPGIAIDTNNNICVGSYNRNSVNSGDALISKITTAGALSLATQIKSNGVPSSGALQFRGFSIDTSGNIYFSGNASYETNSAYYEMVYGKLPNNNSKIGTYTVSRSNALITLNPIADLSFGNGSGVSSAHDYVSVVTSSGTANTPSAFTTITNNLTYYRTVI